MPGRLAQQDDENWWPVISGRGQDSAVGRFGETAPRFGGSPNRPTAEVGGSPNRPTAEVGGSPNRPTAEVGGHLEYSGSVTNAIF